MTHADRHFYVVDGKVLKSAGDLSVALQAMDQKAFQHHVTSHKNDFAVWARDVLKDDALALRLSGAKSLDDMIKAAKVCRVIREKPRFVDFVEGLALGIIVGLILAKLFF